MRRYLSVAWPFALLFAASCTSVFDSVVDSLAKQHCAVGASVRASDSRQAVVFAENYIYVDALPADTASSASIRQSIDDAVERANEIFQQAGANIYIFSGQAHIHVVADKDLVVIPLISDFIGPQQVTIDAIKKEHSELAADMQVVNIMDRIGIHWAPFYIERNAGGGYDWGHKPCPFEPDPDCNFVLMVNDHTGFDLAHELGHYFGLGHVSTPGNLMNPNMDAGPNLTQEQRQGIWRTLNTRRTALATLTCDSPIMSASIKPFRKERTIPCRVQ